MTCPRNDVPGDDRAREGSHPSLLTNGSATVPDDLRSLAASLLALHVPGSPLILPNVWDVPSAQAVVAAGYPVVATSSEAVAQTLGYRDGQ